MTQNQSLSEILIVDVDVDMLADLSNILFDVGYRVESAVDGKIAIRLAQAKRFDEKLHSNNTSSK